MSASYLSQDLDAVRVTQCILDLQWLGREPQSANSHHGTYDKYCKQELFAGIKQTLAPLLNTIQFDWEGDN